MGWQVETNKDELIKELRDRVNKVNKMMKLTMLNATTIMAKQVLDNVRALSGLKVKSGRLLNSISFGVEAEGNNYSGFVRSSGVPYARIHEFGGMTGAHRIMPRNKTALAFDAGGYRVFSRAGVNHPGSRIPARPFMGPVVTQKRDKILELFGLVISDLTKE